ncbi:MAG TPA: hypothetical protein VK841_26565 [Polyangiaceae bacterium]|jgi:hypothetical protein|nr:hypothetical protein [Polyangiaceae bacterium]
MRARKILVESLTVGCAGIFAGACGGASTTSSPNQLDAATSDANADTGPDGTAEDANADDSGNAAADGAPDAGGEAASLPYHGGIEVLTTVGAEGGLAFQYSANFATSAQYRPPGAFSAMCSGQIGSCCFVSAQTELEAGAAMAISAGTIALSDDGSAIGALTPMPGYNSEESSQSSTLAWKAGDVLGVNATGDVVHAFSGAITAGSPLSVVSPALSGTIAISLSNDLSVSWTRDPLRSDEKVAVDVYAGTSANQVDGQVACLASDAAGQFTVPAALLAMFHTGDHGQLEVARFALATLTGDNATIDVRQGSFSVGSATFQ